MTWPLWFLSVLGLLAAWLVWRHWTRAESLSATNPRPIERAVVSQEEAKAVPYPYVHVNNDGSVRELHAEERAYLETPFHPADGGRPYVKWRYRSRDGWGELQGFCRRSKVPQNMVPLPAPDESPNKGMSPTELEDRLRSNGSMIIGSKGREGRGGRWLRILAGLVLVPISLLFTMGSAALVVWATREAPAGTTLLGGILFVVSLWLLILGIRLLLNRPVSGGLMSPLALRVVAAVYLCIPLAGLWTDFYQEQGFLAVLQALVYFGVSAALWKLARARSTRARE